MSGSDKSEFCFVFSVGHRGRGRGGGPGRGGGRGMLMKGKKLKGKPWVGRGRGRGGDLGMEDMAPVPVSPNLAVYIDTQFGSSTSKGFGFTV